MNEKISVLGTPMTADQYAEQWRINSDSFKSEGYYSWMSKQLGTAETILEIGCGSGNGTLSLYQEGRIIVAVEPNDMLSKLAFENLSTHNVPVAYSSMDALFDVTESISSGVIIIRQDILGKEIELLKEIFSFDAIVCWLIGAEPDRISVHIGKDKNDFLGPEMANYREKIHKRCYDLGTFFLADGGCIHIVDRFGISSWNDKDYVREDYLKLHTNIAGESYNISKSDTFLTRARSSFKQSQIQYLAADVEHVKTLVFGSVKARLS